MLWLIIRSTFYFLLLAAAAWAGMVLLETPGSVEVVWGDHAYAMRPLAAVFAAIVLMFALWLIWKIIGLGVAVFTFFFTGDRTALERYWARRAHKRGLAALSESLIALAAGDGKRASAKARRAEMLLDEPALTQIVNAQASLLAGEKHRARRYFEKLSADRDSEIAGIKGLLSMSMEEGDTDRALRLARRAFALQPRENGTLDALLGLQAQTGDWRGARDTLRAKAKAGHLPKDVAARREGVLLLADARLALADNEEERARSAALEAVRKAPSLAPAAALATELMARAGQARKAGRVAVDAWRHGPHPSIAAAFAAIHPDESPEDRRLRFRTLTAAAPKHPETRMLEAELALAAGQFGAARKALGDLAEGAPTARACAIMAAIEKGEGAPEKVVRGWLARALTATRGAQWCCDNCGFIAPDFTPLCPNCDAFDTLTWREIDANADDSASGAAMAPLLVGEDEPEPEDMATEAEALEPEPDGMKDATKAEPMTAEATVVDAAPAEETPAPPKEGAGQAAEARAEADLEKAAAAARGAAGG